MEVRELKFLLKLAALPEYKGKISQLKPTSSTKITDTEKICRRLYDRALVDWQEQVTKFKISSVGKALLKLKVKELPLTTVELQILQACSQETITPQRLKVTPAAIRNKLINSLFEKGLIIGVNTKIKQVWLTDKGKKYLLAEYNPQGNNPVLSLDLLKNYLCLFRQTRGFIELVKYTSIKISSELGIETGNTKSIENLENVVSHVWEKGYNSGSSANKLKPVNDTDKIVNYPSTNKKTNSSPNNDKNKLFSDEQVLQTILDLDRHLNTNNYLPIFYLREKLQPFLSREELDLILYRLQKQDKLELSSIVESSKYTTEQLKAGIPQNIGGCLFFLIVVSSNDYSPSPKN